MRNETSRKKIKNGSSGFTLVEMIVAIALFAVVILVCVSTLLALVNANRKAHALQSVMNNLNITLDGLVRSIRMGSNYDASINCNNHSSEYATDCSHGSATLSFRPYCLSGSCGSQKWTYSFNSSTHQIEKSENNQTAVAITAPEVTIDDMQFYVVGTQKTDTVQPKVVIVIRGSAGAAGSSAVTTFHIEATAVQRVLDL
ncbi:MAG: hypothetical protein RLZZ416_263 [Candidatus Parcubacteria bacterium]|jgi:prepilin-type N-terminal cleavage/methylation domain-containing protein